ncbi:MAG TPA: sulfatase-like hydrolase/transferase, partial [Polyangiaceae bacterium]|nr:sulfatase-like hydrolase/transferase [Polyangiaceae bacterium]
QLFLGGLLAIAAIVGAVLLARRALAVTQRYLTDRRQVLVGFILMAGTYVVVASLPKNARYASYFAGGFASSIVPRLEEEVVFLWNVKSQEGEYATLINQTEQMLAGLPSDLVKLRGANVYLILVESYGRACFEWPPLAKITKGSFDAFERDVKAQGFSVATGVLNSSTYGGQSWLAHNTLDTGIATHSQLEYEIVYARRPTPLATYFNRAGYRSVLVQPNTTRVAQGDFYDFRQKYYNADFRYRGPAYAWATMPDQYVLDFVRRRELEHRAQPLFIQYVLVSSHAPWSKLPTFVDDWDALGDGRIFTRTPMLRFPIEWPHFENATEAYGKSIVYDFDLLRRYITRFIDDGSLVIILGDHQPVAEVNGDSWEFGVPIHVLSKNPDLVRPFTNRGYEPGMHPNLEGYAQGLETFLPSFLVDFSTERTLEPPSK